MSFQALPIGTDDFKKLLTNGYYYIDKTLLIKELLDKKGEVNLFTRPRRFGKTLNLSMLRYFFEDTGNPALNEENSRLFRGMEILKAGEPYQEEMHQYPVISLSLKSARQPNWELAFLMLKRQIALEFERHLYILEGLSSQDQKRYTMILQQEGALDNYADALSFLSKCLEQVHKKPVILLIDEYDVPLENAYFRGFYPQMLDFIRSLFESALKTNPSLHFAVITGCLRITKESIFTGLNNLKSNSIVNENYGEYFGFTESEVKKLLEDYDREAQLPTIQEWYDGYRFGTEEVYNPWSVLNYVDALAVNPEALPSPYWSNTSSNNIIRSLIERADLSVRTEIEELIGGGTIEKPVHEDITYEDVYDSMDNLWNFLFFTGYLKNSGKELRDNEILVRLSIPNTEVRQIYKTKIRGWFRDCIAQKDLTVLYEHILKGDAAGFQEELNGLLRDTISFYDNVEAFYHGFLLGILGGLKTHILKSNRESGDGRFDILLRSPDITSPLILIEIKTAKGFSELEQRANAALEQIERLGYDREFAQEGYQHSIRYGIAFYKKTCRIEKEEISF